MRPYLSEVEDDLHKHAMAHMHLHLHTYCKHTQIYKLCEHPIKENVTPKRLNFKISEESGVRKNIGTLSGIWLPTKVWTTNIESARDSQWDAIQI